MKRGGIAAVAAIAALVALSRRATAQTPSAENPRFVTSDDSSAGISADAFAAAVAADLPMGVLPGDAAGTDAMLSPADALAPTDTTGGLDTSTFADPGDDLAAFLRMIRVCETSPLDDQSGLCYRRFYGNSLFADFSGHPVLTGEKTGVPLPVKICNAAGLGAGCVSTAAGAYQINVPTWRDFGLSGRFGPALPDFSPASQDECAARILRAIGSLDYLAGDDLIGAIRKAAPRWASLPGSRAQQGPRSLEFAVNAFQTAFG